MASTYLTRTISDGSNTKSTFSAWVKRSGLGATSSTQYLFHTSENSNNDVKILFNSQDVLRVVGVVSSSTVMELTTNSFHFSAVLPKETPSSEVGLNTVVVCVILLPSFNLNCNVLLVLKSIAFLLALPVPKCVP